MMLRLFILVGWKAATKDGPLEPEILYSGSNGEGIPEAHQKALKDSKFVAFRKIVNPSGVPMNVVIDPPLPKVVHPDSPLRNPDDHPVGVARKRAKEELAKKTAASGGTVTAKTPEENKAAFDELNALKKSDLATRFAELNKDNKVALPEKPKKVELINAILGLQGFQPPAEENVTEE